MTNAQSCSYQSLARVVDRAMVGGDLRLGEPMPMHAGPEAPVMVRVEDTRDADAADYFIIEPQGCIARTYWSPR